MHVETVASMWLALMVVLLPMCRWHWPSGSDVHILGLRLRLVVVTIRWVTLNVMFFHYTYGR